MSENKSLLPCPFCGGEVAILIASGVAYYPKCSKCYATIDRLCVTENEAIELWNTRTCSCRK